VAQEAGGSFKYIIDRMLANNDRAVDLVKAICRLLAIAPPYPPMTQQGDVRPELPTVR